MRFSHRHVTWPFSCESILDVQPAPDGNWAALTREGVFAILDHEGAVVPSRALSLDGLDLSKRLALHVSGDGRFAAVVEGNWTHGFVTDLATGDVLMRLCRDEYQVGHYTFSVAFFEYEGRALLVHATDWNRLDVSDPLTGVCLTDRSRPGHDEDRYLDYFHSRISVSPDQKLIFDNGWMWHPLGVPRTWSLEAWIDGNEWESEDGPSVRELRTLAYLWDAPMAWIDNRRVIVWGIGETFDGVDESKPGVTIFDAITGEEMAVIEGVEVEPHEKGWIAFDRWLFAVSPNKGTTVWDIDEGRCLHHDPEFTPIRYHPQSECFLSMDGDSVRVSRLQHL